MGSKLQFLENLNSYLLLARVGKSNLRSVKKRLIAERLLRGGQTWNLDLPKSKRN
jgi:hypothetical protein